MPERADRQTPADGPHETLTEKDREIERLRREVERLEREQDRLRRENARLKQQLDAARRARYRQAAPFAKPLKSDPRPPGRKAGRSYGPKARRRPPARVDETHDAPLPAQCPTCGDRVIEIRVATQYQEEIPVPRVLVRAFRVHVGRCQRCGRRVQGRHPLQSSDALGAAAAQLGPQAVASAVILNKQLGLSFADIAGLFVQQHGLTVTPSGLVHAVHRAARHAAPTYDALCATVRGRPMVTPDETGWKVAGHLHWLWTFATPDTTVYRIQPGRGFDEAAAVLGADFSGVLVRDGWAPYRQFTNATHQTCLAHLLRRCRDLRLDHPRVPFAGDVQAILQQALAVRDRHRAGTISTHGLAVARGHLITRLADRLDRPGAVPAVQRFARHLDREFSAIWSFLFDPTIDATNWRAEQALRPAVVTRKLCGGNRSDRGAYTQQILASVVRTAHQRRLDAHALLVSLLRPQPPSAPSELRAPPLVH